MKICLNPSPVKPDVNNDIYLSPLIAPEKILAQFPKTFILCGEKDPLIDDTVVFATRLKRAKVRVYEEYERKKTRSPHDDHLSFHA